jgi:hypothetical protein
VETITETVSPGTYYLRAHKKRRWGCDYTLTLTVEREGNAAPIAETDIIERSPNDGVKVHVTTLLSNDFDPDDDPFFLVSVSPTSTNGGMVSIEGEWIHYAPPNGFTGDDSFTYTISDDLDATASGMVLVKVRESGSSSPKLAIAQSEDGKLLLQFDGIPGRTYRIEYSETLLPASWLPLGNASADELGRFTLTDEPPANVLQRFYRCVYP